MKESVTYQEFFKIYDETLRINCNILNLLTGSNPEIITYDFAIDEICNNLNDHNGKNLALATNNKIYFRPALFYIWVNNIPFMSEYKCESDIILYENDILLYIACHEYVHCVYDLKNHTVAFKNKALELFNIIKGL